MKFLVGIILTAVFAFGAYLYLERPEVLERAGSAAIGKADEMSRKIANPVIMMENSIKKLENYIQQTHVDIAQTNVTLKQNARQMKAKTAAYSKALEPYKNGAEIPQSVAQTLYLKKRTIEMKKDLDMRLKARVEKWEKNEMKAKERLVQQYASLDALKAYMKDVKQTQTMTDISVDELRKITHGDAVDFEDIMNEMEVDMAGSDAKLEANEQMTESLRKEDVSAYSGATYSDLAL